MTLLLLLLLVQSPISQKAGNESVNYAIVSDSVTIRSLLQSSNPQQEAWGAWHAGQKGMKDAIPLLLQVIEKRVQGKGSIAKIPLNSALDALIRLEAKVPMGLLPEIYKTHPTQALILLSRLGPERNPFLLDLAVQAKGLSWFAAANLLLANRSPGFAYNLLKRQAIPAVLNVDYNPEGVIRRAGGIRYTGAALVRIQGEIFAQEYPPQPNYYLGLEAQDNNLLAPGPTNIYYERKISREGGCINVAKSGSPYLEDRLIYISALGNFQQTLPLTGNERKGIKWQSDEQVASEEINLKQDAVRRYKELIYMLREAGLLTADEAVSISEPEIEISTKYVGTRPARIVDK
jgi:hypothetical protein